MRMTVSNLPSLRHYEACPSVRQLVPRIQRAWRSPGLHDFRRVTLLPQPGPSPTTALLGTLSSQLALATHGNPVLSAYEEKLVCCRTTALQLATAQRTSGRRSHFTWTSTLQVPRKCAVSFHDNYCQAAARPASSDQGRSARRFGCCRRWQCRLAQSVWYCSLAALANVWGCAPLERFTVQWP